MNLPVETPLLELLAIPFGMIFGWLLHRGGVTDYNVIVNQFRLKDFTVAKIMLTAILVGGLGVLVLHKFGYAQYHVKPANLLGVGLGAALFGIGMVIYGYCPGTGLAAVATGSMHALSGAFGMLAGGVLYALTFPWVETHIQEIGQLGKVRLPEVSNTSDWLWFVPLALFVIVLFQFDEQEISGDANSSVSE
jgi:uncharacterized membrane protein YedE/YeeE